MRCEKHCVLAEKDVCFSLSGIMDAALKYHTWSVNNMAPSNGLLTRTLLSAEPTKKFGFRNKSQTSRKSYAKELFNTSNNGHLGKNKQWLKKCLVRTVVKIVS